MRQAHDISGKLKKRRLYALYSSPVQRAVQTAQIISEGTGAELKFNDAFRELEMGPWEGLSEDEVGQRYPDKCNVWNTRPAELRLPGRETLDELLQRVLEGMRRVTTAEERRNTGIVTHVAVIRVFLLWRRRKNLNLNKTVHVPNVGVFECKTGSFP